MCILCEVYITIMFHKIAEYKRYRGSGMVQGEHLLRKSPENRQKKMEISVHTSYIL